MIYAPILVPPPVAPPNSSRQCRPSSSRSLTSARYSNAAMSHTSPQHPVESRTLPRRGVVSVFTGRTGALVYVEYVPEEAISHARAEGRRQRPQQAGPWSGSHFFLALLGREGRKEKESPIPF
eukprot:scaffold4485_cov66-Phaeocystis_antarctica.AAC.3